MSKFVISCFLFLLINFVVARDLSHFKLSDWQKYKQQTLAGPQEIPKHTWTEWALIDFEKQKDNPASIVFLGSSLILTPLNLVDANFLNRNVDGAIHHKSIVFDRLINNNNHGPAATFNFSVPGAMASDVYLIANLLLQRTNHADLIIYGVGPRDFLDNVLSTPTSTDPYRCLSKILWKTNNSETVFSYIKQDWQSQLNYFLMQHLPLYGQQEDIGQYLSGQFLPVANSTITTLAGLTGRATENWPARISTERLHKLLPNYDPMAIDLNQCLFAPHDMGDSHRFEKDLNEYRKRYRNVNWDIYTCQTKFLVDLLKLARQHKVTVLVVAMPITSTNRKLLPDYVFTAYKEHLRVLSRPYGAYFIDLDDSGCFSDQDFLDTVHLNGTGGARFLELISKYITQHRLIDQSPASHPRLAETGIKI